jgi:hypothetical protein
MVLWAGILTPPSSRLTRNSRILRGPQCDFLPLRRTIRPRPATVGGESIALV